MRPDRCALFLMLLASQSFPAAPRVVLITDSHLDPPARHGLTKLEQALAEKGLAIERNASGRGDFYILSGLCSGDGPAAAELRRSAVPAPAAAEALVIRRQTFRGKPAVLLCGADAPGLMYAVLDTAERVSWSTPGNPFREIRDIREEPFLHSRGVSIYTMQRAWFERRLRDGDHWRRYFDMLAASRINTFVIIFGYENGGFMAPPYPFFFDVDSFPEVRLIGVSADQQKRNTADLRRMVELAHERGIRVTAAIWDHVYRGGVQGGGIAGASQLVGRKTPGLVHGLHADNLASYTRAALAKFLAVFPGIDSLEFRMHNESGLKNSEMAGFWHEVFLLIRQRHPGMPLILRAKELPDSVISDAQQQGLGIRVETKYWMEQMGMPFHPTHVNRQNQHDRRHGYADLLRYPQTYKVHWRLWNGGTARLLLWADPDYVRRFARGARLYDGDSFEVNEMLATRMLGEPHDAAPVPIHNAPYRHYEHEFERYWHFYQLWGRLSYNPATSAETWEREFRRRFGDKAGPHLMNALHTASRILPRIVASSYPYSLFPTTRGWAEMMRAGDLPKYAGEHSTDIEQFQNARDRARDILAGTHSTMRTPEQTSAWFAGIAGEILQHLARAEKAAGDHPGKESITTATDLKILAGLARYHSHRLLAAVSYSIYQEGGPLSAFDEALRHEGDAVSAWEQIVNSAGNVYSDTLPFGVHRVGFPRHWREELGRLQEGLRQLRTERQQAPARDGKAVPATMTAAGQPPAVELPDPGKAKPQTPVRITARVVPPASVRSIRLAYRHLTQYEDYRFVEMGLDPKSRAFEATIPADFVTPEWDLMYFVEVVGATGRGRRYPDLEKETPYRIVPVDRPR